MSQAGTSVYLKIWVGHLGEEKKKKNKRKIHLNNNIKNMLTGM